MSISNFIYRCHNTTNCLLTYANQSRGQDFFNDVIIKTDYDQNISANRMVLSCYSKYFEKMFKSQMKEQNQLLVQVEGVDGKSLHLLIDYIYTGQILINSDNVMSTLSGADYLQLDEVKEFCFDFMEKDLALHNCFVFLTMADLYRSDSLKNKIYDYFCKNYNFLIKTEDFFELSKGILVEIVLNLNYRRVPQTDICNLILDWIKHDKEIRSVKLYDTFNLVDFKELPLASLENLLFDVVIQESNDCLKLINDAKVQLPSNVNNFFKSKNKILSIGSRKNATKVFEVYKKPNQQSVDYPELPKPLQQHCSLLVDNCIYCIGGESNGNNGVEVIRMNLSEETLKWTRVASTIENRTNFSATVFNDCLVVAGGRNQTYDTLNSTETYIIRANEWKLFSPLQHKRQGNELVTCSGSLFALGGYDGNTRLSSVERLDEKSYRWQDVAPMRIARSKFAAVSYRDRVYVIGGLNNEEEASKTVEMYDPISNTWTYVSDMNIARFDHCACVFNDQIITVGGNNSTEEAENSIERFDPLRDVWNEEEGTEKLEEHSLIVL